jgi:tRNA(Ile)-lysidine synthase
MLAGRWAAGRGGRLVGLVVDHGLRPASGAEAAATCARLADLGIDARLLVWQGEKPSAGIQAAAREARYALLLDACRRDGLLHLLLAHHAGDQAETVWLRREAGSGPAGLAGMPAIAERDGVRLLRPLLDVPGARLRATLQAAGLSWIEDPSNRDTAFARVRARRAIAAATGPLCDEAEAQGRRRHDDDRRIAGLLAQTVRLSPTGSADVDIAALLAAGASDAGRVLSRVLLCVGGGTYAPRSDSLARLVDELEAPAARTLGGCRVLPQRDGRLLICREAGAIAPCSPVGKSWDRRFRIHVSAAAGMTLRPLDDATWGRLRQTAEPALNGLPRPVRAALPVLWSLDEPLALPHLHKWQSAPLPLAVRFRPAQALLTAPFATMRITKS